jgi:hypothetical protein
MAVTSIRNETPAQLTLVAAGGERLVLAPLQEKSIEDISAFDLKRAEEDGIVSLGEDAPGRLGEQIGAITLGGGFWLAIAAWGFSYVEPPFGLTPQGWTRSVWAGAAAVLLLILAVLIIRGTNSFALVARFTTQVLALTVILAIGLGLPAATIYFFGGGRELLAAPNEQPLALFGRLIQLAFIATASLLPVLLFFLFDRFQLGTLRRRLYMNLFRLDRSVKTIGAINAKYGSQIAEAYGAEDQGRGRLAPGSRWPVLVCAIVITIGWIVALAPVGALAPQDRQTALGVLLPEPTALVFGFLGVYFFSLRLIAIRYARGDLKPKAYSYIMVRVLIVAVLSWVLDAIFEGESTTMLVLAFLFGITPDEFFTWLKEAFRSAVPESIVPKSTRLPLTDLEGIDLYDLGRLESEGIVNIEGLAHHELFDLIIETRVPVPRLIDWVDQAILHLHLAGGTDPDARSKLRDYGIRTATDLLQTWEGAERRGKLDGFRKLLGGAEEPYRLDLIRDALLDDEWMRTVSCWRDDDAHEPIVVDASPSTVEGLERWADKQIQLQRFGPSMSTLQRSLAIEDTASTRRRIARIHATSPVAEYRDPDQARLHARRAFELAPGDYQGILDLIAIYLAIGDHDEATQARDAALVIVATWKNKEQREKEEKRLRDLPIPVARPVAKTG